ncbi:MAG: MogA/MoaB family molybdenum cofactor biosynthesis protein [Desulfobacterales bacterium]|jgi:molybdenum cofactor biosynthesis protein B|nr:MogA/MoaB family molybdenum cofactor biosynthesis protein [Desulfobacterales bacterium]
MGKEEHLKEAPPKLKMAIISMSTTRTIAEDKSGLWMKQKAQELGHEVMSHQVIPDDHDRIVRTVSECIADESPHIILMTGGTGLSPADVTIESVRPMFSKELTAFAVLFAQLSFEDIESSAMLSRATAGIIGGTVVFCLPGSLNACKTACNRLIFPEVGHIAAHVRTQPLSKG